MSKNAITTKHLTWDTSSVNRMLSILGRAVARMKEMKAATAAACVMHAIDHGNCTPMNTYLIKVGEGERNDAIVKWAVDFGPFTWEHDKDLKMNVFKMDTAKRTALSEKGSDYVNNLMKLPYWDYVPQREVPAFNTIQALKTLIGRAEKAMKDDVRKAKSDFTGLDDLKALLAKLAPAA